VMPLDQNGRQISIWDPKQQAWSHIDTCFFAHHLYFAQDKDQTLWLSQGGPGTSNGVVGWVKTKTFFETGDSAKAQGWTPIVVDTNGNGKRDAYVEPNEPVDPAKDKRILGAFYGIMPSPATSFTSSRVRTRRKRRSPNCSFRPTARGARAASI